MEIIMQEKNPVHIEDANQLGYSLCGTSSGDIRPAADVLIDSMDTNKICPACWEIQLDNF